MRIPLRKIYRAFPELDRFGDEQCERYVMQATRVAMMTRLARLLGQVALGGGIFVVMLFAGGILLPFLTTGAGTSWSGAIIFLAYVSLVIAIPIIAGLMLRDRMLRRAISRRLKSARCPACDYSLLGLPVQRAEVICPECGEEIDLEGHGLTPEDLLSVESADTAATPS